MIFHGDKPSNGNLYEILIPNGYVDGKHTLFWSRSHHKTFDEYIKNETGHGGLTISAAAKGKWVDEIDGLELVEDVLPVRCIATPEQMKSIANTATVHYDQKEVMYYLLSEHVYFVRNPR